MSQTIPVFLHIPKNAGTYVLSITKKMLRFYAIEQGWANRPNWNFDLRIINVMDENNKQPITLLIRDLYGSRFDTNSVQPYPGNKHTDVLNLKDLDIVLDLIKDNKIFLFCLFIQPRGVKFLKDNFYEKIFEKINKTPCYFTIFRHPYKRALSLYNYITSDNSKHEPTHGTIKAKTFEEYIGSNQLNQSWLIQNLCDIRDGSCITENQFKQACSILSKFKIEDISNTDKLIDSVFTECYNITRSIMKDCNNISKNTTKNTEIEFESLNKETRKNFSERTKFDRRLYNRFIKH